MKNKPVHLPLAHALAWIVGSTLLFSGGTYTLMKEVIHRQARAVVDPKCAIRSMIQTGPQRQALKTEYLAELLGLSSDRPVSARAFSLDLARERLMRSALISDAHIKWSGPNTLYVDYTVRQPIAWLEDYDNVVVDREGYPFPFSPFFSPKHLPLLYLGLGAFGIPAADVDRPTAQWGKSLQGKYFSLALHLLDIVTDPKVATLFSVKRIDVSNAFRESYGTREIVLITEDFIVQRIDGKDVQFCLPRILRLSTKDYALELGRYLKLREQLLEEERKTLSSLAGTGQQVRQKEKIIDFRIQQLAFIEH
jgi:acyl-CoA synthetase (AMP-forming)/AMP-acid ligase II